MGCSSN